jgi:glycosyltransferase involved in cell wall biosynthesis
MASGLCCVTPDYGGPAELLANGRGVKVPMGPPDELTRDFTQALERLVARPEEIRACGDKARGYAQSMLTWDVKARLIVDLYRRVLDGRGLPQAPFSPAEQRRAA